MAKRNNMRTCTIMVFTDGTRSIYAVMIGRMVRGSFRPIGDDLARYEVVGKPDYVAMTARHATVDASAVDWQV